MQNIKDWKFDLRLHDGEGGSGDGSAGDGGAAADAGVPVADAVPTNPSRQRRQNPLASVKYGRQPEAQSQQTAPEQPTETPDDRASRWKAAKEEFRDLYSSETSEFVQKRLGESKQHEANLAKLAPMLENMAKKYGKEASDIDGIMAAYTDDDSLYEEEAAREGVSVDVYKQLKQLRADKEQRAAQQQQDELKAKFEGHIRGLIEQGEKLKATFPNFDLRAELQNPIFARLTSPEVGVDVETAYWTVHRKELNGAVAQVAAQKSQEKLSQSIQSGRGRPAENGARSVSPGLDIRTDPSKLSKADREEIKRRVARGEKIYF